MSLNKTRIISLIATAYADGIFDIKELDYINKKAANLKIKKDELEMSVSLKKTPDILKDLAKIKKKQIVIGFALETESEKKNAYEKMKKKSATKKKRYNTL